MDKVIIVRYVPTGLERDMLFSTYTNLKNKAQWEYVRDKHAETPVAQVEGEAPAAAAPKKKKGCNCKK